jgi:hypothetical protein
MANGFMGPMAGMRGQQQSPSPEQEIPIEILKILMMLPQLQGQQPSMQPTNSFSGMMAGQGGRPGSEFLGGNTGRPGSGLNPEVRAAMDRLGSTGGSTYQEKLQAAINMVLTQNRQQPGQGAPGGFSRRLPGGPPRR